MSGQEACAILARHGFVEVRRRSSHIVMQRQETTGTTTVPVPDHRELKTGTLRSIIAETINLLRQIKERADAGDLAWLRRHGKVYEAVGAA